MFSHFRSSGSSIGLWTNPVLVRLSRCCGAPTEGLSACASGDRGARQCFEWCGRHTRAQVCALREGWARRVGSGRAAGAVPGGGPSCACCQEGRAFDAPRPWWPPVPSPTPHTALVLLGLCRSTLNTCNGHSRAWRRGARRFAGIHSKPTYSTVPSCRPKLAVRSSFPRVTRGGGIPKIAPLHPPPTHTRPNPRCLPELRPDACEIPCGKVNRNTG